MSQLLSAISLHEALPIPVTLPASPVSASVARQVLHMSLSSLLPRALLEDMELMASELVANAVVNAASVCALAVSMPVSGVLRVAVSDFDPTPVALAATGPRAERGRGLQIVHALSARWGSEDTPPVGKTVWFEVAIPSQ